MKLMKTLYLISLLVTLSLPFSLQAAEEVHVTVYGDAHYPPYSWKQNDKLVGIYPAILRRAFARMKGYRIEMVPIPWKRGLRYLEHGRAFALFPPYLHLKKRPYMSYSTPILPEQVRVVCHERIFFNKPRERWPEDFYGALIGKNLGFAIGGEKFYQAIRDKKLRVREIEDSRKSLLMVASGRLDCYINDINAIEFEVKRLKADVQYSEIIMNIAFGPVISEEMGYLGFTRNNPELYPYKEDFVIKFNQIILGMQEVGEIEKIIQEFFHSLQTELK